jgi:hypothetical protein
LRDCASQLCTRRPNHQQRRLVEVIHHLCDAVQHKRLICGPHAIRNCFMTMPRLIHHTWFRVSWPNTSFQLFARLSTLQSWLLVISGCPPNWRGHWGVPILIAARISCGTRWRSWEAFQRKLSRNASNSGRNDGLSAWSHKGPTLKGIRNWAPGKQLYFPGLRSELVGQGGRTVKWNLKEVSAELCSVALLLSNEWT